MTVRNLGWGLVALTILFGAFSWLFPPSNIFHCLDAFAISSGAIIITAYVPALRDAWRSDITPSHLLAFGVITNWVGLMIRLGRWYVTGEIPQHTIHDIEPWAYNVGLWISICGALMLVGALATSPPVWSNKRIMAHTAAFLILTMILLQLDFIY